MENTGVAGEGTGAMERPSECSSRQHGKDRMGLRIIKNNVRADYDGVEERYVDIIGRVEIRVLESCHLQDDIKLQIAELLAAEAVTDDLPNCCEIDGWAVSMSGDIITVKPSHVTVTDNGWVRSERDLYDRTSDIHEGMSE